MSELDRIPPQAIEMEINVLGAILLESSCLDKVLEILSAEMFYKPAHASIFRAICDLRGRGDAIDITTVVRSLNERKTLESCGGAFYISSLAQNLGSSLNIETHARIVLQMAIKREIIGICAKVYSHSYLDNYDIFTLYDELSEAFSTKDKLMRGSFRFKDMRELISQESDEYSKRKLAYEKGEVFGVTSGFYDLDTITGGWQKSDLIIIAGRPAMGKTSLMMQFALNSNKPVGVFSIEMASQQLMQRLVKGESEVDATRYNHGTLSDVEFIETEKARGRLEDKQIFIDDSPILSVDDLRMKVKQLISKHPVGLLVVDYLQIMKSSKSNLNREAQVSEIARGLKSIGKEFDLPIIALAQLSRASESTADKKPLLSHLRESGSIEQEADMVIFIHRAEYYGITQDEDGNSTDGKAELIIAKQRNGGTGSVYVNFIPSLTKFTDPKKQEYQPKQLMPNKNFYEKQDSESDPF